MLTEICQYLRNWFARDVLVGDFVISGRLISGADGTALSFRDGQYFRVVGSLFNDGVHKYADITDELTDEEFAGAVWFMAVPPDFLKLCDEIGAWVTANQAAINSPYNAESFGGYSYSLRTSGGSDQNSIGATWQSQFASRLSPWRKI